MLNRLLAALLLLLSLLIIALAPAPGAKGSLPALALAVADKPSLAPTAADRLNTLTETELADGWILLFDGRSLYGWRPAAKADWRVVEGAIVVGSGEVGLLRTTTQYSDYVLKVDFRSAKGANSGIFLRTSPRPIAKNVGRDFYELNIADTGTNPYPTGSLSRQKKVQGRFDSDGWQSYEVTVDHARITVKLDGREILSYTDPGPLGRGFIGLQHNTGRVEFRNIKLKPLGTNSIFNGKDLSGWKAYPNMKSVFSVTPEGHLNVKDGRGQLETAGRFGDFVLQLECISYGKHLNSGIFFRCIPGEVMMGYESQIHNGFRAGDRTKPIDCGTGGIFRRKNARRVVSDDFQWFYKTIIAEGPHIAVWVNGQQVCDCTDKRQPHGNPRKGLRTQPGTIMIQGHDPTTNLSFRNFRVAQMRPRR